MSCCAICRLPVRDDGTAFQAFGRALFTAHESCAPMVHAGMRLLGMTALTVGREALRHRAPAAFAVLESARTVVQRFGELQGTNQPVQADAVPPPRPQPQRARTRRQPSWHPPENVIDVQGV